VVCVGVSAEQSLLGSINQSINRLYELNIEIKLVEKTTACNCARLLIINHHIKIRNSCNFIF